jgi:hypothetical protein
MLRLKLRLPVLIFAGGMLVGLLFGATLPRAQACQGLPPRFFEVVSAEGDPAEVTVWNALRDERAVATVGADDIRFSDSERANDYFTIILEAALGAIGGCSNCGPGPAEPHIGTNVVADLQVGEFDAPRLEGATVTYRDILQPIDIVYTPPSGIRTTVVLRNPLQYVASDSGVEADVGDVIKDGG